MLSGTPEKLSEGFEHNLPAGTAPQGKTTISGGDKRFVCRESLTIGALFPEVFAC